MICNPVIAGGTSEEKMYKITDETGVVFRQAQKQEKSSRPECSVLLEQL